MDLDPPALSRERAASSEQPCSTRPHPFDDDHDSQQGARKRQRVSGGDSPSMSVEVNRLHNPAARSPSTSDRSAPPLAPQTPTRPSTGQLVPEPSSNRVTLNLRAPLPQPPSSSSPPTASTMSSDPTSTDVRRSIEVESDSLPMENVAETPSLSPQSSGSPHIEVVSMIEVDSDYADCSPPPVTIIDGADFDVDENDPISKYPFRYDRFDPRVSAAHFDYHCPRATDFEQLAKWFGDYAKWSKSHENAFFEGVSQHRDFWAHIPDLVASLRRNLRRDNDTLLNKDRVWELTRQPLGDLSDPDRKTLAQLLNEEPVAQMFHQFAHLTARLVVRDIALLNSLERKRTEVEPDLISRHYLWVLGWLVIQNPLDYNNLYACHRGAHPTLPHASDFRPVVQKMMAELVKGGATISAFTLLAQCNLKWIPRFPKLVDCLTVYCRIVSRAVVEGNSKLAENAEVLAAQGYAFYEAVAPQLPMLVDKHVTFLNHENAKEMVHFLGEIARYAMGHQAVRACEQLLASRLKHPELPDMYLVTATVLYWKLDMYDRFIRSGQMQLRVAGVVAMGEDLLDVHNTHVKDNHHTADTHPLLLHVSKLILEHKFIDYIIGTGSHPEIITASGHIVWFLLATRTYSDAQIDAIWNVVSTSQDPRVVQAILSMMTSLAYNNMWHYHSMLYLFKKFQQLPLELFTAPVLDFLRQLIRSLSEKIGRERIPSPDSLYDLLVRLVRESSVTTNEIPRGSIVDVQQFADASLRHFCQFGPEEEVRKTIYSQCIEDISAKSPMAAGSISVITLLWGRNREADLRYLTEVHHLPAITLDELESKKSDQLEGLLPMNALISTSRARRDLLYFIITCQPQAFRLASGLRFWQLLVVANGGCAEDREAAWQILLDVAQYSGFQNEFIVLCFEEYIPQLEPQYFTLGCLEFVRRGIQAWFKNAGRSKTEGSFDAKDLSDFKGLAQLWRMVLDAPRDDHVAPAITVFVDAYLDYLPRLSMSNEETQKVHIEVIRRCLRQLSSQAPMLRSDAQILDAETNLAHDDVLPSLITDDQRRSHRTAFIRSLLLLREFFFAHQRKFRAALPKGRYLVAQVSDAENETMEVKYQSFDGDKTDDIKNLSIGKLATVSVLFDCLRKATGFTNCKIYHFGKTYDPERHMECYDSLEDLRFHQSLILVKRTSGNSPPSGAPKFFSSVLEREILDRLDQLWEYLGMENAPALQVFHFLRNLPVYEKLREAFESTEVSSEQMFPPGQPFKCLYAIHAMHQIKALKLKMGQSVDGVVARAGELVIGAICNRNILRGCSEDGLRTHLATQLLEYLTNMLKDSVSIEKLRSLLNEALVERLLDLLQEECAKPPKTDGCLISKSFEGILEISSHSASLWHRFISKPEIPQLLRRLLLDDPRPVIRGAVMKQIIEKCNFSACLAQTTAIKFTTSFWPLVLGLIPEVVRFPHNCKEVFALAAKFLKRVVEPPTENVELSTESVDFATYLGHWGKLLVGHDTVEEIEHPERYDSITYGLSDLLSWCIKWAKNSNKQIPSNVLASQLFAKHLFPDYAKPGNHGPVLHPVTRKLLSDVVLDLSKDDEAEYRKIWSLCKRLVPYNANNDETSYSYELPYSFDRFRAIRSPTGYVGLGNLGNTCYLNSLLTQLFMNVSFREFMINARISDSDSQPLLWETRKLFCFMQNSIKRFVDPTELAFSTITWEDEPINPAVQMDVHEFYDLLFSRWEDQVQVPEEKKKLKSFFGGQLVQQVKSKECDHISERLEDFSAIQCDIKGKASLQESLQAYVDGEIMEGDNKYKCSTCDKHVDAVKRACLKDVPDNLIFHLKRFDFDIQTSQRNKINAYFSFPHKIDMRPYKVEHLMDGGEEVLEDIFELTGIVVHSGTAQLGHYYSFVRERPASASGTWVEFNDDTVSQFDPRNIESQCFGGTDFQGQDEKSHSAYMLFYQRSSSLHQEERRLQLSGTRSPFKLPLPSGLQTFISDENDLVQQKYCLYDESHIALIFGLLGSLKHINKGRCSEDHELEQTAISLSLGHVDQVVSRAKNTPYFAGFTVCFRSMLRCPDCCKGFLWYLTEHPDSFRNLVLKNPDAQVRSESCNLIIMALQTLKQSSNDNYGFSEGSGTADGSENECEGPSNSFQAVLRLLGDSWNKFFTFTKAWPDYFGLLNRMAQLGLPEAHAILDAGYLLKTQEMILGDSIPDVYPDFEIIMKMHSVDSKRHPTKPVRFDNAIALLDTLLELCEVMYTIGDQEKRQPIVVKGRHTLPLKQCERDLLELCWTTKNVSAFSVFVWKLLKRDQNMESTQRIIATLLGRCDSSMSYQVTEAIGLGIQQEAGSETVAPFLDAAITVSRYSTKARSISRLIQHVGAITRITKDGEDDSHLFFFTKLAELRQNAAGMSGGAIRSLALSSIIDAAPALLTWMDDNVRRDTDKFLREYVFGLRREDFNNADAVPEDLRLSAPHLGLSCLDWLEANLILKRESEVDETHFEVDEIHGVIEFCKACLPEEEMNDGGSNRVFDFIRKHREVVSAMRRIVEEERRIVEEEEGRRRVAEGGRDYRVSDIVRKQSEVISAMERFLGDPYDCADDTSSEGYLDDPEDAADGPEYVFGSSEAMDTTTDFNGTDSADTDVQA